MKDLKWPLLILRGEKDEHLHLSQAPLLRDELARLKKEFELKLFPYRPRRVGSQDVTSYTLHFFKHKLAPARPTD